MYYLHQFIECALFSWSSCHSSLSLLLVIVKILTLYCHVSFLSEWGECKVLMFWQRPVLNLELHVFSQLIQTFYYFMTPKCMVKIWPLLCQKLFLRVTFVMPWRVADYTTTMQQDTLQDCSSPVNKIGWFIVIC